MLWKSSRRVPGGDSFSMVLSLISDKGWHDRKLNLDLSL